MDNARPTPRRQRLGNRNRAPKTNCASNRPEPCKPVRHVGRGGTSLQKEHAQTLGRLLINYRENSFPGVGISVMPVVRILHTQEHEDLSK